MELTGATSELYSSGSFRKRPHDGVFLRILWGSVQLSVSDLGCCSEAMLISYISAFLAGVVVLREGAVAISLTKRLEDSQTIVFLPLVWALDLLRSIWLTT
jgi:hypothetical protein